VDAIAVLVGLSYVVQVLVDLIKGWINDLVAALYRKPLPENFHKYTAIIVSILLGELLAFQTGTGLMSMFGITVKHQWVDVMVTGLMLAGGSNIVNQAIEFLRQVRKKLTSTESVG